MNISSVSVSARLTWTSTLGRTCRVAFKNSLTDTNWTSLSPTGTATSTSTSWTDTTTGASKQRFYIVYVLN